MTLQQTQDLTALTAAAKTIRLVTHTAWILCLGGDRYPYKTLIYQRMQIQLPGDLVVEITTLGKHNDLDAVGTFLCITQELVDFGPNADPWDEKEEGPPHPTENRTHIRTLDGREFCWHTAQFLTVSRGDQ
jgi:hypothetical protein